MTSLVESRRAFLGSPGYLGAGSPISPLAASGYRFSPDVLRSQGIPEKVTKDLEGELIDSVVSEQDKAAAAVKRAQIPAVRRLEELETKALAEAKETKEQLLQALTPSDIFCQPMVEERKLFRPYYLNSLFEDFKRLATKTATREPRLVMTVLKGSPQGLPSEEEEKEILTLPADLLNENKEQRKQKIQQIFFRNREEAPRVSLGVQCRMVEGVRQVSAKNVAEDQVNSQYYHRKSLYTVYLVKDGNEVKREISWDIFFDPMIGSTDVHWVRLEKAADYVLLNLTTPEYKELGFEALPEAVRYFSEKINRLTQESFRITIVLQRQIDELKAKMKANVTEMLGKHKFVGALSALADCLLDGFDPETGEFKKDSHVHCLKEMVRKQKFFADLREIKARRSPGKSDDGDWVDKLTLDITEVEAFEEPGEFKQLKDVLTFKTIPEGEIIKVSEIKPGLAAPPTAPAAIPVPFIGRSISKMVV